MSERESGSGLGSGSRKQRDNQRQAMSAYNSARSRDKLGMSPDMKLSERYTDLPVTESTDANTHNHIQYRSRIVQGDGEGEEEGEGEGEGEGEVCVVSTGSVVPVAACSTPQYMVSCQWGYVHLVRVWR